MADDVKIIRLVIDSSKARGGADEATRALQGIESQADKVAASLQKMEDALDAGAVYAKLVAVAAGGKMVVDKLLAMFTASRDAAAAISDLSEQLGVSTSFVQASQYSAAQHTISLDKMTQGYTKATQIIGQAAQGQKAALDIMDGLGVKTLDAAGKLRSTESILQDAAANILKVEDPARRVAMVVDLFGKSGAQLIPMLADLASGSAAMAVKAQAAGAMIDSSVLETMGKLKSQSEEAALKWNALVATLAAPIAVDALERFNTMLGKVISQLERGRASGKGFWDTVLQDSRADAAAERRAKGQSVPLWLLPKEEQDAYRRAQLEKEAGAQDDPGRRAMVQEDLDRLNRGTALDRAISVDAEEAWARRYKLPAVDGGGAGAGNPKVVGVGAGGGGGKAEDTLEKLKRDTRDALDAQRALADAADLGAKAVADLDIHYKALKATEDAYAKTGKGTADQMSATTRTIEAQMLATQHLKDVQAFKAGSVDLEKTNEVLALQNSLAGESVETITREVGLLKLKQEIIAKGFDENDPKERAMLDRRRDDIALNAKLVAQGEEIRKANELWTEPLKQALRDIQQVGASAFESMLESGKISFESLRDTFSKIIRRMAAEFLALATIRPVMSVMVQALSGAGLMSPATASSLGFSSGSSGMSIPGLGGIGSWGSSIGGWLNSPISGNLPSTMYGPPAPGQAMSSGFLGDVTWGQGLGALAGAGMGVYQLMNSKSTAGTIGGISSILGAGVSLIPGIGQIAGPAIALLGNLLPGLFGMGETAPTITNQEFGQLAYGPNGFGTSGGAWGPTANASNLRGPLGQMGTTMQGIFDALGGVKDPSQVWGVALQSFAQQYGNNGSFSNQTSFLVGPNGERRQWGQGSNASDIGMEAAGVAATLQSIMGGAVGQISENLRKGLGTVNLDGKGTFAQLSTVVAQIKAFDDAIAGLDKTMTSAEQAVAQIDAKFGDLYTTANQYGLATGDIDAAKAKARLDYATGFGGDLKKQILQLTNPQAAALQDLDAWKADLVKNNDWLVQNVTGALDEINDIERLYGLKRAAIVEASAQQSLSSLEDIIKRLTYGDLSNASTDGILSGTSATYAALVAKAKANDPTAIAGFGAAATDYATAARSAFASSPQYEAIRQQIIADAATIYANSGGSGVGVGNEIVLQALQQVAQNLAIVADKLNDNADSNAGVNQKMAELSDLMQRLAVNR